MCRNTSYSNVSGHGERSFVDNGGAHGIHLRHHNNYKDNYSFSSNRIAHSEINTFSRPRTNDHVIRISVNQNDEHRSDNIHSFDNIQRYNIEESESAASVTIVDIDDNQSSDEESKPHFIRNSLHSATPTKPINTSVNKYTEKAVDCPEEFERKAYASQLSPFTRNIEPNSQVCFYDLHDAILPKIEHH